MSGFAGVVLASRMTSGQPMTSQGFELDVISACVLGGVSMAGGIASIWFVLAGVMIMGMVQNMMNLSNVPTFYQYIARGGILLVAVIFDRFKQRR
jgi:L-arabinose transport system permease protein